MKTSRPQPTIKGNSKISICVTLITLLHSTITIYLTFTEVKKIFPKNTTTTTITIYLTFTEVKKTFPKNTTKDKKREVWSETNFQTLTRSKKINKKYGSKYFFMLKI